jgi:hypothetical protein
MKKKIGRWVYKFGMLERGMRFISDTTQSSDCLFLLLFKGWKRIASSKYTPNKFSLQKRFNVTFDIMSSYIYESMLKSIHAVSGCGTCPGIMIWRRKQRPQMPQ